MQKQADKEFEAEKRRWSWEKEYERGQGMRMSQDYGRCRNGKGRLKHCRRDVLTRVDYCNTSFKIIRSFCIFRP